MLTFRQSGWLSCLAFILHVLEEWPRFTHWAKVHVSSRFTRHDYNTIHIAGIAVSVVSALIVWLFPNRTIVFLFFAFVFAPAVFFNAMFHAGASPLTRTYCPSAITTLAIYLPLFALITDRAWVEGLLGPGKITVALVLAGLFHALEVGHNVFKAW